MMSVSFLPRRTSGQSARSVSATLLPTEVLCKCVQMNLLRLLHALGSFICCIFSPRRSWTKCWLLARVIKMSVSSCCEHPVTMSQQSSGSDLNASCDWPTRRCNWTLEDRALELPTFTTAAKVRVTVTFILCGISTLCNLAVLWAANGRKRKSHVRVLIINLTAADLLVTFIVMPVDAVWNITVQWLAGDLACRFLMFLKLQAMYSCAFVTVVISLDRQSAILKPLAISMARKRNKVMLTVAWSMSALFSIPQVRKRDISCGDFQWRVHLDEV